MKHNEKLPSIPSTHASLPRSILFVPADRLELVEKAKRSGADCICLDLEDGVAPGAKQSARVALLKAAELFPAKLKDDTASEAPDLMVRVNSEPDLLEADLSCLPPQCQFVMLPKAQGVRHINKIGETLDALALAGKVDAQIVALIEDARGLQNLRSLSLEGSLAGLVDFNDQANQSDDDTVGVLTGPGTLLHHRLSALAFGVEDFSADLGVQPSSAIIEQVFYELCLTARALGVFTIGYPASIAEFKDLEAFVRGAKMGAAAGAVGALAIHPKQVELLNEVFSPEPEEINWATMVVDAFLKAGDKNIGAIAIDGRMIDRPIYLRAVELLKRRRHKF